MTTARDIVTMALKDLSVVESGEEPAGGEATDGLDALNQMLASWIYDGIDLEFENLSLSSIVPYPDDHIGPFRYNLAVRLAPQFEVQPSVFVVKLADDGYLQLQRNYLDPDELGIDEALRTVYNPNGYYVNTSNF